MAKECVLKGVTEERLAKANNTRIQKVDLSELVPGAEVDLYRLPSRKDQSGWRGPCELAHLSPSASTAVVIHNGYPYLVPLRHVRKHILLAFTLFAQWFVSTVNVEEALVAQCYPSAVGGSVDQYILLWSLFDMADSCIRTNWCGLVFDARPQGRSSSRRTYMRLLRMCGSWRSKFPVLCSRLKSSTASSTDTLSRSFQSCLSAPTAC